MYLWNDQISHLNESYTNSVAKLCRFFVDWNRNEYVKENLNRNNFSFFFLFGSFFFEWLLGIVAFFLPFFQIKLNTTDWGESVESVQLRMVERLTFFSFLKTKSAYHTIVIESKPQQFTKGNKLFNLNLIHNFWCWCALTPGFQFETTETETNFSLFLSFSWLRRSIFNSLKICSPH